MAKRETLNEMRLVIDSRSANEGFARAAVGAFVAQLDPTVEELSDVRTAVSEAVTNCIVHGYRDGIGKIYIQARIYEGGVVMLRIRDGGVGIENVRRAMEPLFTTGGAERGGLGFTVMESFMDSLRVRSQPGRGTTVTMEKKISRRR